MRPGPRLTICFHLIAALFLSCFLLLTSFTSSASSPDSQEYREHIEIVRDTWGVAHVYAKTDAGVFFGAGFATAQDRMLQMDLVRRTVQGRLSEILGRDWVEHDKRVRTMGLYLHAQEVAEHLEPDTREALEAYAAGINHFLSTERQDVEAVFAELGWMPEPWTVADSIAVWMRLSERFDRSWQNEVHALRTHQARAQQSTDQRPPVIDNGAAVVEEADFVRTNPEAYRRLKALAAEAIAERYPLEGGQETIKASHAWAVSGNKTVTGMPLLESDPQIAVTLPSLWHEIHLHGGKYNARGIGVAGAPGFLIGWNEHLAWGATALGSDNVDLFLERLDASGQNYEYRGSWRPLKTRIEEIKVLGGESVFVEVRETQHGPLVDDFLQDRRPGEHYALHYVVTQELHTSIEGLLAMMRSTDWESFTDGLSRYHSPGLHIVYADVYGNIGYHTAAAIPIRTGAYGLPQVGWTGDEEWAGYIPFDELPQSLNPERGFVASANHLPVGDWYPHNLTVASPGHTPRSLRLYELLADRSGFSVEVFEESVHRDNISPVARDFIALANRFAQRDLLTPDAVRTLDAFARWDGRMVEGDLQSAMGQVLLTTIHRSLGSIPGTERLAARFGGGYPGIIHLLRVVLSDYDTSGSSVWDGDVAVWMSSILGQIGSQRRRAAAGTSQPQVMLYQTNLEGFGSLDPTADRDLPELTTTFVDTIWSQLGNSYTHIVDLSDIDNSRAVLPPGVSENPRSAHYFDQVDLWVKGAARPAPLSRDAVMLYAESVQVLEYVPGQVEPVAAASGEPVGPDSRAGRANSVGSLANEGSAFPEDLDLTFSENAGLALTEGVGLAFSENADTVHLALLEPPDGRVYHGTSPSTRDVDAYIAALGDPELYPAVEGMHSAVPGTRPQYLERTTREFLERVRAAGRIPHLSFSMSIGDGQPVDDVIALSDTYDDLIWAVGRVIRDFGDPVFVRIGFEFNGSWNGYHPGIYPKAFRKFVDLLRAEGADNFATIWCYEPNGPGDFDAVGSDGQPLWYPGDDYVDWFGIDLFQHTQFVSNADSQSARLATGSDRAQVRPGGRTGSRASETPYDRTVRFLEMARQHGKPVYLSELAGVDAHLTPDSEDPDFADGKADWALWFEPFFAFLAEHPEIKGFNYMSQDYRGTRYEAIGWGNARIQTNSYVKEQWINALRDERFLHAPQP